MEGVWSTSSETKKNIKEQDPFKRLYNPAIAYASNQRPTVEVGSITYVTIKQLDSSETRVFRFSRLGFKSQKGSGSFPGNPGHHSSHYSSGRRLRKFSEGWHMRCGVHAENIQRMTATNRKRDALNAKASAGGGLQSFDRKLRARGYLPSRFRVWHDSPEHLLRCIF